MPIVASKDLMHLKGYYFLQHLHPWTLSEEEYERERAMELVHHIFQLYFDKVDTGLGVWLY